MSKELQGTLAHIAFIAGQLTGAAYKCASTEEQKKEVLKSMHLFTEHIARALKQLGGLQDYGEILIDFLEFVSTNYMHHNDCYFIRLEHEPDGATFIRHDKGQVVTEFLKSKFPPKPDSSDAH